MQTIPVDIDLTPLASYIETDDELTKAQLIHRVAGKVSYGLLQFLKCLVFLSVYKDASGKVYLV